MITREEVERAASAARGRQSRRRGARLRQSRPRRRRWPRTAACRSRACARRPRPRWSPRLHRAARDRVPDAGRHPHDEAGGRGCASGRTSRDVKVSPLLIAAKALISAVRQVPRGQRLLGRGGPGDRAARLGQPRHRRGHPARPDRAEHQGGRAADPAPAGRSALAELTATAREGKTALADLTGGTITITNVGVFGVDTGTPILNPGEAAILAFGAIKQQPWVHKGKVKPRWVTTLAPVLRPPPDRRRTRLEVPPRTRPRPGGPGSRAAVAAKRLIRFEQGQSVQNAGTPSPPSHGAIDGPAGAVSCSGPEC